MTENRRDIPKSVFSGDIRAEKLVLSELLTDTDSQAVVEFSGHRGRIEDDRTEIQEFLKIRRLGQTAIKSDWEDAETDTPSAEYDRYDTW